MKAIGKQGLPLPQTKKPHGLGVVLMNFKREMPN
jgi:hypothetical protein